MAGSDSRACAQQGRGFPARGAGRVVGKESVRGKCPAAGGESLRRTAAAARAGGGGPRGPQKQLSPEPAGRGCGGGVGLSSKALRAPSPPLEFAGPGPPTGLRRHCGAVRVVTCTDPRPGRTAPGRGGGGGQARRQVCRTAAAPHEATARRPAVRR